MKSTIARTSSFRQLTLSVSLAFSMEIFSNYSHAGEAVSYFQIQSGSLTQALNGVAQQAGISLLLDPKKTSQYRVQPFKGHYTIDQALSELVEHTPFQIIKSVSGYLVTEKSATKKSETSQITTSLSTIFVTAHNNIKDAPYQTPGSASYISSEEIHRFSPTSLGDIFKSAPGVIAPGSRVGASVDLNIRGLQGQNRVNVMVDGTRQSNHTYRGYRGSRTEVYVDPDFLSGVDITKGPVATAGGVGAMGGVVNMRTIEASDIIEDGRSYTFRVKGGLGSNTTAPPATSKTSGKQDKITSPRDSSFNLREGDNWSGNIVGAYANEYYEIIAGVSRRQSGNYFAGSKGKYTYYNPVSGKDVTLSPFGPGKEVFNTSQDMTSALAKVKLHLSGGHSFALGYIHYQNEYGEMDENFLPYIRNSGNYFRVAQHDLSKTQTRTFKSTYEYKPENNELISLMFNLWYTDVASQSNVIRAYSGGNGTGNTNFKPIETGIRTFGGDISNKSVIDTTLGALSIRNGIEYLQERAQEDGGLDLSSGNYLGANPNGNRTLASVFSQTSLKATDWLTIFGSLRYDYYQNKSEHVTLSEYREKSGKRLNSSLGVTLEPLDGFQIFSTYSEGWRPPSLRETAIKQASGVSPNQDLRPETSSNIEVGMNLIRNHVFQTDDTLRFKAVYFNNTYDDYVIRDRYVDPEGFWLYKWDNIDKSKFNGYEFSTSYDSSKFFASAGLTLYSQATFCRDKEVNMITFKIPVGCGADKIAFDYGVMNIPPKYSGNVTAGLNLLSDNLTFGSRIYFFGKRFGDYKQYLGASIDAPYYYSGAIVDIFGHYKLSKNATFDFSAENIGDRYYLDPLSTGLMPAPGRSFKMSLTTRF